MKFYFMKTKNTGWLGLAALLAISPIRGYAQTPGPPPVAAATAQVTLSPGSAEVVKLAQSGVSDDVVLAYIQNQTLRDGRTFRARVTDTFVKRNGHWLVKSEQQTLMR